MMLIRFALFAIEITYAPAVVSRLPAPLPRKNLPPQELSSPAPKGQEEALRSSAATPLSGQPHNLFSLQELATKERLSKNQ
ncbi:hypothetical protein OE903_14525 [Bacillus sp. B6(2022)]|nr:hypothetical protein [Bacillus sp. B6(2022)]